MITKENLKLMESFGTKIYDINISTIQWKSGYLVTVSFLLSSWWVSKKLPLNKDNSGEIPLVKLDEVNDTINRIIKDYIDFLKAHP
jgi:hypothetical protein